MNEKQVMDRLVLLQYAGSTAYGTRVADSDEDTRGVCIAPPEVYLSPFKVFEQKDSWEDGADRVIYEYQKAIKLIADGNPNMVELLHTKEEHVLLCTPEWQVLIDNSDLFLSQRMKHSFSGYAFAQLKKLNNGQSSDTWNETDHKMGYKCKHGMHLVRLLRMGLEIVRDGEVNVFREDADELLAIRGGSMTIEDMNAYAKSMEEKIDEAMKTTCLPKSADRNKIEEIVAPIVLQYLLK